MATPTASPSRRKRADRPPDWVRRFSHYQFGIPTTKEVGGIWIKKVADDKGPLVNPRTHTLDADGFCHCRIEAGGHDGDCIHQQLVRFALKHLCCPNCGFQGLDQWLYLRQCGYLGCRSCGDRNDRWRCGWHTFIPDAMRPTFTALFPSRIQEVHQQ